VTTFQPVLKASREDSPRRRRWFRKRINLTAALFLVLTLRAGSAHATAAVLPQTLGWRNILFSTIVLVSIGALPLSYFGICHLARSLLVSASRCVIQVSLMGSLVLQRMMGVTKPEIVAAWILGVGLIAGRESISRIQYSYPNMNRNMYGSVVASGLSVLGLTLSLNLFGKVTPWFDPRTWIPIAGMLFGNTLNASALTASSITKQFATGSETVELRWMRGATTHEAIFKMSLMPTINGLAASGIIHIPGMMSGQILAGQSPQQASLYQIVINFLIASTTLLSVQLIIHSSVRSIVDTKESRLRCGVLEPKAIPTTTRTSFKSFFAFANRTKYPSTPANSIMQGG
jgi:putative ABC transport system permease protein